MLALGSPTHATSPHDSLCFIFPDATLSSRGTGRPQRVFLHVLLSCYVSCHAISDAHVAPVTPHEHGSRIKSCQVSTLSHLARWTPLAVRLVNAVSMVTVLVAAKSGTRVILDRRPL